MWKARLSELAFNERELAEVLEALDSEWITSGPRTEAFENAFTKVAGTTEAVAVSNGTAALFLALKALGGAGLRARRRVPAPIADRREGVRR